MVAPEGPFGRAIGQAVLDDQSDGQLDDPAGVMAAGVGQVGHVGVEVLAAAGAIVLGIEHHDIARPPGEGVAQIMESAATDPIPIGAVAAVRAGAPPVDPAPNAIPHAAISETSSNCWKFSVISVSSSLACVVERPSRTFWMAA